MTLKLTKLVKLIGDNSRLELLKKLKTGSLTVSELVEKTKLSQTLVSHHLRDLKDGGLVEGKRQGRWMYYSLSSRGRKIVSVIGSYNSIILKLIGDNSRREILSSLRGKNCSVSKLIDFTGLSQSLVSHHLRDLKDGQIVTASKEGRWVNYGLTNKGRRAVLALESL
jgi:DNA-binding transcriptional ArsR family regulator